LGHARAAGVEARRASEAAAAAYATKVRSTEACAATGESRRCANATTAEVTAASATAASEATRVATPAAARSSQYRVSKANQGDANYADKFHRFHVTTSSPTRFGAIAIQWYFRVPLWGEHPLEHECGGNLNGLFPGSRWKDASGNDEFRMTKTI
jgi:hypothetical protein